MALVLTWEHRRAIAGLIEVAQSALQTAQAICPSSEPDELTAHLVEALFAARGALVPAERIVGQMAVADPVAGPRASDTKGGQGG